MAKVRQYDCNDSLEHCRLVVLMIRDVEVPACVGFLAFKLLLCLSGRGMVSEDAAAFCSVLRVKKRQRLLTPSLGLWLSRLQPIAWIETRWPMASQIEATFRDSANSDHGLSKVAELSSSSGRRPTLVTRTRGTPEKITNQVRSTP